MEYSIYIAEMKYSLYAPIVLASIITGMFVQGLLMKKSGVRGQSVLYGALLTFVSIMVFCFIFSIWLSGDLRSVGFVGAGGAFGLVAGAVASSLIFDENKSMLLTSWILVAPLMYGLSKIACHTAGCCYGIPYHGYLNVVYESKGNDSFFPVQLAETTVFVFIFVIGLIIYLKAFEKKENRKYHFLSAKIVIILSAAGKIGLEFLRYSHIGKIVSTYQVIIFIIAMITFVTVCIFEKLKILEV